MNRKSNLLLGVEGFNDRSLKATLEDTTRAGLTQPDVKKAGVFVGHELLFGRLAFVSHLGFYVYAPYKSSTPYYERLGLKYHFTDVVFGAVDLKIHRGAADVIEFKVGREAVAAVALPRWSGFLPAVSRLQARLATASGQIRGGVAPVQLIFRQWYISLPRLSLWKPFPPQPLAAHRGRLHGLFCGPGGAGSAQGRPGAPALGPGVFLGHGGGGHHGPGRRAAYSSLFLLLTAIFSLYMAGFGYRSLS